MIKNDFFYFLLFWFCCLINTFFISFLTVSILRIKTIRNFFLDFVNNFFLEKVYKKASLSIKAFNEKEMYNFVNLYLFINIFINLFTLFLLSSYKNLIINY